MLRLATAVTILFFALTLASAQSSVNKFSYQPSKIVVGTIYHYVKTNIDGTNPEYVSQYVATKDRLEVFKFHPKGERAALVVAYIDWSIFSARGLESWQVSATEKKLFATLKYLAKDRTVEVSIPVLRPAPETTAIKYLPFHVYNFDFGSLNFAFRHLVNPTSSFTIGVADPTFKEQGPLFAYRGEATVTFAAEEQRNGVQCRKYRIDGAGLDNRGGYIWVNKDKGHVEDMEIDFPDNPDWQTFKFKLLRVETMTPTAWEGFMKQQF
jgi:hypothetical protein